MITRIIEKEDLNASTVPYNFYKLNAQAYSIINKVSNVKGQGLWWDAWGLTLIQRNVSTLTTCRLWTTILLGLAPLRSRVSAPRDLV
jgi:hypothetical protein